MQVVLPSAVSVRIVVLVVPVPHQEEEGLEGFLVLVVASQPRVLREQLQVLQVVLLYLGHEVVNLKRAQHCAECEDGCILFHSRSCVERALCVHQ